MTKHNFFWNCKLYTILAVTALCRKSYMLLILAQQPEPPVLNGLLRDSKWFLCCPDALEHKRIILNVFLLIRSTLPFLLSLQCGTASNGVNCENKCSAFLTDQIRLVCEYKCVCARLTIVLPHTYVPHQQPLRACKSYMQSQSMAEHARTGKGDWHSFD